MNITPKAKQILEFFKLLHEQNRLFKTTEITIECDCTLATAHKWIREFKYSGLVELEYINATKRYRDGIYKVKSINLKQL